MNNRRFFSPRFWTLAILGAGLLIGSVLMWTAPQTQPEDKLRGAKIVQTLAVAPANQRVTVTAYGPVIPARKVVVKPEVRGRIIRHHPSLVPGGFLHLGEELIVIDPSNYTLALTEQETALEESIFQLAVEKGRQVIASREWQLLESDLTESEVDRALVLREPHLRRTEAMIRKASNEIAKAQLDLSRTSVTAPFNSMVLEESVEVGQLVEPGTQICTLVGTDEFWVQATLPLDKLKWIRIPGPDRAGSSAEVILDTGNGTSFTWQGTVVRLLSDLEPSSRMARVLVQVPDPLGLSGDGKKLPLLLDSYVQVQIEAGELSQVLAIPRSALRQGNRIWVVDGTNTLHIRETEILWTRHEEVLINNCLQPGEQLVVSSLKVALPGMLVEPQASPLPGESGAPFETANGRE